MKRIRRGALRFSLLVMTALAVLACGDRGAADPGDAAAFREAFLAGRLSWTEVEERAAREGEVEFYHWGGSEALNSWMETSARPDIERYDIRLNLRRSDTRDVVDLILADMATGRGPGEGTVDMVWINGENFRTLKDNDALFGSFAALLPNSRYFALDPDDPASSVNLFDFGTPTELMEMPWAAFQYTFRIDTERVRPEDVPRTFAQLEEWMRANPGRFAYVAPPHYIGTTFVQTLMYEKNPDGTRYEPFLQDPADLGRGEFIRLVKPAFEYLRRLEPYLLGGGGTEGRRGSPVYPATAGALQSRFVGGEVDFDMEFGVFDVDRDIRSGVYPESVRNIIFPESGMITDKSFLAIPWNAPNPAAALVAVNALSSPASHLSKLADIGYAPGLDLPLLDPEDQESFRQAAPDLHGVTAEELAKHEAPNVNARFVDVIDAIWMTYVAERSEREFEEIVADAWDSVVR
ncbi:MAG: ABC transporter substrate-binding protein [Spirochaetaceae bacterium]|nr:MAG: ABC transporter substrate-binding protein [Spirochaetaceae bacterium]